MPLNKKRNYEAMKANPAVLTLYAQYMALEQRRNGHWGICPFHDDTTPSLQIQTDKTGAIVFRCQACNTGGDIFKFIELADKVDFVEARDKVVEFLEGPQKREAAASTFQTLKGNGEKRTLPLLEFHKAEEWLADSWDGQEWLKGRGIAYETAKRLHAGYIQEVKSLSLKPADEWARDKGWVVFPYIAGDQIYALKYRSIATKAFTQASGMYTTLFNIETVDPILPVYVVEGEVDALTMEQAGFNTVSLPSGNFTKLPPNLVIKLKEAPYVVLAGDNDNVGSDAMDKLWAQLGKNSYKLVWPEQLKDANEVFLSHCNHDVEIFRMLVRKLTSDAKSRPAPGFYSMTQTMLNSDNRTNLANHPDRLRFPWPAVDQMAILLPGSVLCVFATNTKMGKTAWVLNVTVAEALRGQTVLNYQAELQAEEINSMVAAYLLRRDRNCLSHEDFKEAAAILEGKQVNYFIGRNPSLNTIEPVLDLIESGVEIMSPNIVVLDHLHYLCRNVDNEVQAQANAMQRIKNMAVAHHLKFIVVGQARKANQANRGKQTHITDAKGSETFSSDADAVFSIHRDWIKNKNPLHPPRSDYDNKTIVEMKAARSMGMGGSIAELMFVGEWARFETLEDAAEQNHQKNLLQLNPDPLNS